ncbi:hypothetical protein [Thiohalocapsa halophila]|nr:hypothetical protein [Thiohalocapsa halophila]
MLFSPRSVSKILPVVVLGFLSCLPPAVLSAAERRQSGEDTARHAPQGASAGSAGSRGSGARLVTPSARAPRPTLMEAVDPAVRQYWSNKCVQQRARGWGHTGDCNHPAYSGSGYGRAPVVVPYPVPVQPEPRRRRGHLGIQPPRPGGRGHLR